MMAQTEEDPKVAFQPPPQVAPRPTVLFQCQELSSPSGSNGSVVTATLQQQTECDNHSTTENSELLGSKSATESNVGGSSRNNTFSRWNKKRREEKEARDQLHQQMPNEKPSITLPCEQQVEQASMGRVCTRSPVEAAVTSSNGSPTPITVTTNDLSEQLSQLQVLHQRPASVTPDGGSTRSILTQPGERRKRRGLSLRSRRAARTVRSYCQETTLHGWKYVMSGSSTKCEKTAWLLLLCSFLGMASVLVYRAVNDFMSHTVSTNMDSLSTSFDNLYFPAITVCNMNFMQRSVLEKYNIEHNDTLMDIFERMIITGTQENFTAEELQMFEDIEKMTNGSGKLKMEGVPKCHNMFLKYSWRNEDIKYSEGKVSMHYGQTTDASVCCQIFPGMLPQENNNNFDINNVTFWTKEKSPWQFIFDGYKKGIKPGKQGVQVLIDVETYEYFSVHSHGSEGVLVLIQHYRDVPLMRKESFVLGTGAEVDVGLGITEITTSRGAIDRFKPEERDCYTADEVNLEALPLSKGYRMSMKNCLYDKALHATKEECGCSPPFYVIGALGKLPTCRGKDLNCAYKIFDDMVQARPQGTAATCRAPCDDQVYTTRIATAGYPNKALFSKRKEICHLIPKLVKICTSWVDPNAVGAYGQYSDELAIKKRGLVNAFPTLCGNLESITLNSTCPEIRREVISNRLLGDDLYAYARKNLLWLNVYIKDSFATRIVRDERMTRISFVANVGGLLGLCMGFSLVSVAELAYFFCKKQLLDAFHQCWKKLPPTSSLFASFAGGKKEDNAALPECQVEVVTTPAPALPQQATMITTIDMGQQS